MGSSLAVPEAVPGVHAAASRELRLALVLYGGVSLAIYMHGVTKELERLIAASRAYEADPDRQPFTEDDTAAVYWRALKRRDESAVVGDDGRPRSAGPHEEPGPVRTRVVVDIISGTSAGGINGVFLAAAIARNRSQAALRDMWMERGDIERLLIGREGRAIWRKIPRVLLALRRGDALLDGGRISRWLRDALTGMGAGGTPIIGDGSTLLGEDDRIQLFVPVTDYNGYAVQIPADDPAWILDHTHRHVLRFVHDRRDPRLRQLSEQWDDALAFAARATSSFPGAFPPLSVDEYRTSVSSARPDAQQLDVLFAPYSLAGADVEKTYFIDGGVLDNKPFRTTLAALELRPASTEVDRRLIYLEPDPSTEPGNAPDGTAPGLLSTAIAGYAGIPRQEPIIGDLQDLEIHNATVGRLRNVIETNFAPLRRTVVHELGGRAASAVTAGDVRTWREQLLDQARQAAGLAHPTYLRLRVWGVIDDLAGRIARRWNYPSTSSHAVFVRRVLVVEAERHGLFRHDDTAHDLGRETLDALDIAYIARHVRFLIAAINWWYHPSRPDGSDVADDQVPSGEVPTRAQLDAMKQRLYRILDQLDQLEGLLTDGSDLAQLTETCFGPDVLTTRAMSSAGDFADEHAEDLATLRACATATIVERLHAVVAALDEAVAEQTADWSERARVDLLTRHLGFSSWDVILYPIQTMGGVGERDHVEVMRFSPHESELLATAREKTLKGVALGHFGAFFSPKGRQNDYLWGRLDATERLLVLLHTQPDESTGWHRRPGPDPATDQRLRSWVDDVGAASHAIVAAERGALALIPDRLQFATDRASHIDRHGRPRTDH
jgi:patatin-related protein